MPTQCGRTPVPRQQTPTVAAAITMQTQTDTNDRHATDANSDTIEE